MKASQIFFLLGVICLIVAAGAVHWALAVLVNGLYMFACAAVNDKKEDPTNNQPPIKQQ